MEAPDAGLEAHPLDPQEVEGLGIDDVKATTAIHEHLGEACVGDNRIDNKRKDPGIGDVVWVIITIESDGHLGPVKEEGVAGCTEKISRCSHLHWHVERRVKGPSYIKKQLWISGNPSSLSSPLGSSFLSSFFDAYAFKISSEHVAVLEVVVRGPLVVGTWLFEHFVKDAPARGPSRFLAISSSNKFIG
jgi:hypothetical protein